MRRLVVAFTSGAGGGRGCAILQQDKIILISWHIAQASTRGMDQRAMLMERHSGGIWLMQLCELLEKAQDSTLHRNMWHEGELLSVGGVPSGGVPCCCAGLLTESGLSKSSWRTFLYIH